MRLYRRRVFVRDFDWILFLSVAAILIFGLVVLYSAGRTTGSEASYHSRQLIWMAAGLMALLFALVLPFRALDGLSIPIYGVSILMLLFLVFMPGRGADRWISLGFFHLQPSEAAKIGLVLMLARVLSDIPPGRWQIRRMIAPALVAGVPFVLVMRQPDLGTSLVFGSILLPMLFWAGLPMKAILLAVSPVVGMLAASNLWAWVVFLLILFVLLIVLRASAGFISVALGANMLVGIAAPILWNGLHSYQQARILTFLDPGRDPLGAGYQIIQSAVAIGSGGFLGKGFLQGTQKGLSFLPEQHTDFIFSVVGEEFGFIGCAGLLLLYTIVLIRMLQIAVRTRNRFAALLVIGFLGFLSFQIVVNVGMTLGLVPVTGLPLPLMSYGGSSLITSLFAIGAVLSVGLRRTRY